MFAQITQVFMLFFLPYHIFVFIYIFFNHNQQILAFIWRILREKKFNIIHTKYLFENHIDPFMITAIQLKMT